MRRNLERTTTYTVSENENPIFYVAYCNDNLTKSQQSYNMNLESD